MQQFCLEFCPHPPDKKKILVILVILGKILVTFLDKLNIQETTVL